MAKSAKIQGDRVIVNTEALLDILGINKGTLSKWEADGCPKESRGNWCIKDVLMWRGLIGSFGVRKAEKANEMTLSGAKLKYETQVKQLQAEQLEIKNAISRGDYLPKSEIVQQLSSYFMILKRSLNSLARKLSIEIGPFVDASTGRRIEKQLTDVINEALEQLAVEGVYEAPKERKVKG